MHYLKKALIATSTLLAMAGSLSSYGEEGTIDTVNFPFQNITINAGNSLRSAYSFKDSSGKTHPIIYCFQINNSNISITWPYKGSVQSGNLPIQLKTDAINQGSCADINGTLIITNNSGEKQLVSCLYGF